jgi:hypothetical protein
MKGNVQVLDSRIKMGVKEEITDGDSESGYLFFLAGNERHGNCHTLTQTQSLCDDQALDKRANRSGVRG